MEAIGGRKFVFAVLLIAMGFSLVLVGNVTADVFFKFAELVGAGYVLGNVASKFSN